MIQDGSGLVAFALFERFTDADDRPEARRIGRHQLAIDRRVGFSKETPALRVADDHVLGACFLDHPGGYLAGIRALALPVHVLRSDAHIAVPERLGDGMERGKWRADHDLDVR